MAIEVAINGNEAGLKAAFASAQKSGEQFAKGIQGQFDGIMARVGKLQTAFVGLGSAILAGGAFSQATDAAVSLTKEATALGRALGITTTDASVLNVALGDVFTSSDVLMAANARLTRTLATNEAAFTSVGIATRDSNGHLRNSLDIMLDVNQHLLSLKEGTDRNVEGARLYGRGWAEVQPILKLTAEVMEQSRIKARELGLEIGEENVAATMKYRVAMHDVSDVLLAAKKVVGDAVMPELTKLGNWFSDSGPQRIELTRKAIYTAIAAFYGLKNGVEIVFNTVKNYLEEAVHQFITFSDIAAHALSFDFSGALAIFNRELPNGVFGAWGDAAKRTFSQITASSEDANKNIMAALQKGWNGAPKVTPTAAKGGGGFAADGPDKGGTADKSRLREFENQLDQLKLAQEKENNLNDTFIEFKKSRERDFWKDVLARHDLSVEERMQVERKYVAAVGEVRKLEYEGMIGGLRAQLEAYTHNMDARLSIARKIEADAIGRFGADSKQAQEAAAEIVAIERKKADQLMAINKQRIEGERAEHLAQIDQQERDAELIKDLGAMREADLLVIKRDFLARRQALEMQANMEEMAAMAGNPNHDPVAFEQLEQKRLEILRRYRAQEAQLTNQLTLEKQKPFDTLFAGVGDSAKVAFDSALNHTRNFGQQFRQIWQNVITKWAGDEITLLVRKWIFGETTKTAATEAGAATRTATEGAAAATSTAMTGGSAIVNIGAKAWEAAASVYASIAQIPIVGPFLAPAMALTAAGAVLGFASKIFSAEGGMDIPAGINPLIQAHAEEMVLPKPYANMIRSMAEGGAVGGGGDVHIHVQAWDGRDVKRFLKDQGPALVASLSNQRRGFNIK